METTIRRIAHLSDVHVLDSRPGRSRAGYAVRTRYLSMGRPLTPELRLRKLQRALLVAKRSAADHVIISGDLTETGDAGEYSAFAEALHESELDPEKVTLVPGNHDAYATPGAWQSAIEGPLAPYAGASAGAPGKVVERGDVCILPLDVSRHQHFTRSSGEVTTSMAEAIERRASDPSLKKRALLVVAHHPPFGRGALDWFDGLRGGDRLMALLARHENVHAMHGHLHSATDCAADGAGAGQASTARSSARGRIRTARPPWSKTRSTRASASTRCARARCARRASPRSALPDDSGASPRLE